MERMFLARQPLRGYKTFAQQKSFLLTRKGMARRRACADDVPRTAAAELPLRKCVLNNILYARAHRARVHKEYGSDGAYRETAAR